MIHELIVSGRIFNALQPPLRQLEKPNLYINDSVCTLAAFQKYKLHFEETQPRLLYRKILQLAYAAFAESLSLPTPSTEAEAFGNGVGE